MKKREIMIGGWVEPIATLEDYRFAREMGITHMFIGDSCFKIDRGTKEFFRLLDMAEEAGLKVVVRCMNTFPLNDDTDYSKFPAVWGMNYWDEPFIKDFDKLKILADEHVKKYGDKLAYFINLNPPDTTEFWHPWGEDETYDDYISRFCSEVLSRITVGPRILSADFYPIVEKDGKTWIKSSYLVCLDTLAKNAREYKTDTHFYLQGGSFKGYEHFLPIMTEIDLRFQIYALLSFGIRNFTYYTYADYGKLYSEEGYCLAMVSNEKSCTPHSTYFAAQTVDREITGMEEILTPFTWENVISVYGEQTPEEEKHCFDGLFCPVKESEVIKEYKATQNTLIGIYGNKTGGKMLVLSNYTLPKAGKTDNITLKLNGATDLKIYRKGKPYEEKTDGTLNISLEAGEGALIIL